MYEFLTESRSISAQGGQLGQSQEWYYHDAWFARRGDAAWRFLEKLGPVLQTMTRAEESGLQLNSRALPLQYQGYVVLRRSFVHRGDGWVLLA